MGSLFNVLSYKTRFDHLSILIESQTTSTRPCTFFFSKCININHINALRIVFSKCIFFSKCIVILLSCNGGGFYTETAFPKEENLEQINSLKQQFQNSAYGDSNSGSQTIRRKIHSLAPIRIMDIKKRILSDLRSRSVTFLKTQMQIVLKEILCLGKVLNTFENKQLFDTYNCL